MPRFLLFVFVSLLALSGRATAADNGPAGGPLPAPPSAHPISIERAWARPTAGTSGTGAIYMTIINDGREPDQLLSVETSVARQTGLHAITMQGDVVRMRETPVIPIPATGRTVLRPGAWHIMLTGLTAPLEKDGTFPVTLVFKKAGRIAAEIEVRNDQPGSFWGLQNNERVHRPVWNIPPKTTAPQRP